MGLVEENTSSSMNKMWGNEEVRSGANSRWLSSGSNSLLNLLEPKILLNFSLPDRTWWSRWWRVYLSIMWPLGRTTDEASWMKATPSLIDELHGWCFMIYRIDGLTARVCWWQELSSSGGYHTCRQCLLMAACRSANNRMWWPQRNFPH